MTGLGTKDGVPQQQSSYEIGVANWKARQTLYVGYKRAPVLEKSKSCNDLRLSLEGTYTYEIQCLTSPLSNAMNIFKNKGIDLCNACLPVTGAKTSGRSKRFW